MQVPLLFNLKDLEDGIHKVHYLGGMTCGMWGWPWLGLGVLGRRLALVI